jgi:hypothetical protein
VVSYWSHALPAGVIQVDYQLPQRRSSRRRRERGRPNTPPRDRWPHQHRQIQRAQDADILSVRCLLPTFLLQCLTRRHVSSSYRTLKLCQSCAAHINTNRPTASPSKTGKIQAKGTTKEPVAANANALFWARAERERKLQACPKPVVVVTRAVPPGRTRVLFSKANMKHGSTPYIRYLSQVLPRISPPEPEIQKNASSPAILMESVRNIACSLKRRFGRPSFRFALGRINACLLSGPIVTVAALQSVCGNELLAPVIQHVRHQRCSVRTLLV